MNASQELDIDRVRADFPILAGSDSDRVVYLDSAATSQKPAAVIEAIRAYYEEANSNVHRAVHSLAGEATRRYEDARKRVARFVGARSESEIVFTSGATESINLVASSFGERLDNGDVIILTEMEHHANIIPWQLLAKRKGIELRFLHFDENGVLDIGELENLWSDRVKLLSLTHVSNVLGTTNDVSGFGRYAHERGVPFLVDAAQSVPHRPIDVGVLECDFLVFSGHKLYGPTGTGALFARREHLEAMEPYKGGGDMIKSVWLDRATWNDIPHKFEAGTPNIAGAVGLGAAVDYLEEIGMDAVLHHEEALVDYALERIGSMSGIEWFGPKDDHGPVLSFVVEGIHPHDVAQFLDRERIAVRPGHHCAQPVMRKLGIPASVRASFGIYSTKDDIDRLVASLYEAMEFFSHGV